MFFEYKDDPLQLPPLTLAYIGDVIYELYVRNSLLMQRKIKVQDLHKEAIKRVNASTQARLLEKIEASLTKEELSVARRGRNAKSGQVPKNADVTEYRKSTGLEALVGYLYLKEDSERLRELLANIEEIVEG